MQYLSFDGWDEFQKYRGKRAGFILDATDQFERRKLTGLSLFTRGLLQELRRLRGRTGENVLYDIAHIARAIHAMPTDRPHLQHAIDTLIARGILVLTNQQVDFSEVPEKENKNEKEKDKEQNHCVSPSQEPLTLETDQEPGPTPESIFAKAYACYPRHVAPGAAEKAWGKAINRESAKCVRTYSEHEDFIYQKVMHYGAVMRRKLERHEIEKQFIPHMATWLNRGSFGDEETEWEVTRQEQRNGQVSKADQRERERDRKWAAIAGGDASHALSEGSGIGLRPGLEPGTNRPVVESAQNATKILAPRDH